MTFSSMIKRDPFFDEDSESEQIFIASSGLQQVAKRVTPSETASACLHETTTRGAIKL